MHITELPDTDKVVVLTEGDLIAFIEVQNDEDSECPNEWGNGRIVSRCTRHNSYDDALLKKAPKAQHAIRLGYYEHGNCLWFVAGHAPAGADCRWDGVPDAGWWLPGNEQIKQLRKIKDTVERGAKAVEMAKDFCDVFTAYCNGEAYCATVDVYKVRKTEDGDVFDDKDDYRFDEEVSTDHCGGYFVYDDDSRYALLEFINTALAEVPA